MLKHWTTRLSGGQIVTTTTYYLNSTVLGGLTVAELNSSGQRTKRYLYAGARKLAEEVNGSVTWSHEEPISGSRGDSTSSGAYVPKAEFNADGVDVGLQAPEAPEPDSNRDWPMLTFGTGAHCSAGNPNCVTCSMDGFEQDCAQVAQLMDVGTAAQCLNNDCGPRNINGRLSPMTTDPRTGRLGYGHWERN